MKSWFLLLLLAFGLWGCRPEASAPQHLILVTVDTLRADGLSCYGNTLGTSDAAHAAARGSAIGFHLDQLAAEGTRYTRAYAPRGMTFPSLATLFTGLSPLEHGALSNGDVLDPQQTTLAEKLTAQGFRCAAFTTNKLLVPRSGIEQGFEHFVYDFGPDRDRAMAQAALDWLAKQAPQQRCFVWLHLIGPHLPYEPGPEFLELYGKRDYQGPADGTRAFVDPHHAGTLPAQPADHEQMRALYWGEVARIDRELSHFFQGLARLPHWQQSLTVFTADHGEELAERNRYYGHSKSVYETVLHVPLFVRAPGRIDAGKLDEQLLGLDDLGLRLPQWLGLASESQPPKLADYEVGMWSDSIFTVRDAQWRLVWNPQGLEPQETPSGAYPIPRLALYHTAQDPAELHDVAAAHPQVVERLQLAIERWRALQQHYRGTRRAPDAERQRAMRDMGYAGEDER
jgi:arylsulfatase A-like enzyme